MAKQTYLDLQAMSEAEAYRVMERLKDLPRPSYPFPDITPPYFEQLRAAHRDWVDKYFTFHTKEAREKHKTHYFIDINARAMPHLTFEEQLPLSRFTTTFSMLDDYTGHTTVEEMQVMREKIWDILTGKEEEEPVDLGIYRQAYFIRKECLECGMPPHLYNKFAWAIDNLMCGYQNEKQYVMANTPPPFVTYSIIREITAGVIPYGKYTCMQKNYRTLPDIVLDHPHILYMHAQASRIVGYHNDITSLPKELSRHGDVINIVLVLMHEHGLDLEDAYMLAMEIHDNTLKEFITLQENLPDFGKWQDLAYEYAQDLGTMIQGIWSWHIKGDNNRYVPGYIVDPEYKSQQWQWKA